MYGGICPGGAPAARRFPCTVFRARWTTLDGCGDTGAADTAPTEPAAVKPTVAEVGTDGHEAGAAAELPFVASPSAAAVAQIAAPRSTAACFFERKADICSRG
jgi:hypothetical protein